MSRITVSLDWNRGAHGSTYSGNPISCAAALASIALVEAGLMENAANRGSQLRQGLESLQQEFECVGDVRGLGLMQATELVSDRHGKTPDKNLRDQMLLRCFENGLLLLICGESTIRFCPPLITTADQVNMGLEIFSDVLKAISG